MIKNPDYLSVANNIFTEKFPDAACAFVAGSITTGHGTESSDIDLIILFNDETHETYRESITCEGWPVEIFVHNLKSQDYFMNEDLRTGKCATLSMIITGILIDPDQTTGLARKEKAESLLQQGPIPMTKEQIDHVRYFLTDLLDDLRHPKDPDYIPAILAEIFVRLGNFHLRAQNKWSGDGKQLIKIMKKEDPALTERYLQAFKKAETGKITALENLMAEILHPYGGLLFEGYKSVAEMWK